MLDPLALTSGVIELLKGEAERRNVQLRLEGRAAPILADPVGLEQILHNLIGNALQAFDRRVETCFPVEGKKLVMRVKKELDAFLTDNTLSWLLQPDGSYVRNTPSGNQLSRNVQSTLLERLAGPLAGGR